MIHSTITSPNTKHQRKKHTKILCPDYNYTKLNIEKHTPTTQKLPTANPPNIRKTQKYIRFVLEKPARSNISGRLPYEA